jgi:predicted ferric reductase
MSTLTAGSRVAARPAPHTVEPGGAARIDRAVRLGAVAALWSGLVLVTWWWVAGGGVQDLRGWESGLTSVGRLTGLLASGLLLSQVLLMSRLPVLERAFGQDRLVHWHRVVGFWSFDLMVGHVVLVTWGYAAGDVTRTPATAWELVTRYPGVLLAAAGTIALVLVVVTSVRAARARLRYESWHLLHLYAYLGVGLALPHQLWTGQEFLTSTAATVFWWGLWALAAGAVLVWRVALPLVRSARHRIRVTSVVAEGDGVVSVYMTGRHLDRLPVRAGQFLIWRFLGRPGWTRGHPYSLSAAPDGRSLRITVKDLGDGSAGLRSLRPGTRVLVEGPHGRLSTRVRTRPKVALIGAGVGITPLRALAEELEYAAGDAVLLHRSADRPLFAAEFEQLARERGLQVLHLSGSRRAPDSWLPGSVGPADDLTALLSWVPDIAERDVYVCGPEEWTDQVRRTTRAAGLPAARFHVEAFRW